MVGLAAHSLAWRCKVNSFLCQLSRPSIKIQACKRNTFDKLESCIEGLCDLRVDSQSSDNAKLRHQTWQVLEELQRAGRVRGIGVSNFTQPQLEMLLEFADIKPAVNQIEVHPCYQQSELRDFCKQENIAITAYASLGCGTLIQRHPVIKMAADCGKSPAQVLLRWGIQSGCAVIPKSVRPERVKEFAESNIFGWELSEAAMSVLDNMPQEPKICWNPSNIV